MFVQPIPISATSTVGTLNRSATDESRTMPAVSRRSAARSNRERVIPPTRSHQQRAGTSSDTITMLTQYVATMFVASLIGLAMTVPSDSTQALSGAAVVSGALGMLSAVAALALGYAKAVHVANHDG